MHLDTQHEWVVDWCFSIILINYYYYHHNC